MFFIIKIDFDEKGYFQSFSIQNKSLDDATEAYKTLVNTVKAYVSQECGEKAGADAQVIEIRKIDQVNEPLIDGILLYKLSDVLIKSWYINEKHLFKQLLDGFFGQSNTLTTKFGKTCLFELVEYEFDVNQLFKTLPKKKFPKVNTDSETKSSGHFNDLHEMVPYGKSNINVPKIMTVKPMSELIRELKDNKFFKSRFNPEINENLTETSDNKNEVPEQKKLEIIEIELKEIKHDQKEIQQYDEKEAVMSHPVIITEYLPAVVENQTFIVCDQI